MLNTYCVKLKKQPKHHQIQCTRKNFKKEKQKKKDCFLQAMQILYFFSFQNNCWWSANEASYYAGMFTAVSLQAKFKGIQTITLKIPVALKKIPQWCLTHPLSNCKLVLQVTTESDCKESRGACCRSGLQTHGSASASVQNPMYHHIPLRVNHSQSQLLGLGGSPCSVERSTGWNKEGKTVISCQQLQRKVTYGNVSSYQSWLAGGTHCCKSSLRLDLRESGYLPIYF